MFTGIITAQGSVEGIEPLSPGRGRTPGTGTLRLLVSPGRWSHTPKAGDSISVDGCCLTVAEKPAQGRGKRRPWVFHVVPETLSKTTLGSLAKGDTVHLEHAMGAGALLDGHIVQGHVDGVAEVVSVQSGDGWRIRLAPPPELMPYVVPKGSVSLAGVSLTVAEVSPAARPRRPGKGAGGGGSGGGWFEVALIPATLERTHLGRLKPGDLVNLECDPLAKTVVHFLKHYLPPPPPPPPPPPRRRASRPR